MSETCSCVYLAIRSTTTSDIADDVFDEVAAILV